MKSNKLKIIAGFLIVIALPIILLYSKAKFAEGISIKKWDNYYDENNIVLFMKIQKVKRYSAK